MKSRFIYQKSLGRTPEDFESGLNQIRQVMMSAELDFDEAVLYRLYPKPVWGVRKQKH